MILFFKGDFLLLVYESVIATQQSKIVIVVAIGKSEVITTMEVS